MNNYNLTIAIPTKDRYDLLYNLLKSLDFQSYTNFLVLIIDVSDVFREIDCSIYKLKIEHHRFKYPNFCLIKGGRLLINAKQNISDF